MASKTPLPQGERCYKIWRKSPVVVTWGTWPAGSAARCELLIYMSLPSPHSQ